MRYVPAYRRCTQLLLWAVMFCVAPGVAAEGDDKTSSWVIHRLQGEIGEETPDLNTISSLLYPLTSSARQFQRPEVRSVLDNTASYLATLRVDSLECGQLADLKLSSGFLGRAGVALDSRGAEQRLADCNLAGSLFDSVNALIFYCRYSDEAHQKKMPGALEAVERAQLPNGSFAWENGKPWFYLTSHAVLALYYCAGDPRGIASGQQRLQELLPRFYRAGFIDGLTESLIFLHWMGIPIPDYSGYLHYLRSRRLADGGICFLERPGCQANWHATSLLLELENLEQER
jgi:hypothetical protein